MSRSWDIAVDLELLDKIKSILDDEEFLNDTQRVNAIHEAIEIAG